MADYSSYTKEQLVQEVFKKEVSKQKCKEKLVLVRCNPKPLLAAPYLLLTGD